MMYRITDKKDQWICFVEGRDEAIAAAFDYCVVGGLRIAACDVNSDDYMFIGYIDPDDGNRYSVVIENIDNMLLW